MQKIGDLLKVEREKKGLSLHEVGIGLKINPKILKAIEDGDTANLPAKTFLRGFIRSYALYLKMDANALLSLFQQELGSTRPEDSPKKAMGSTPAEAGLATPKSPASEVPLPHKPTEKLKISHNDGLFSNRSIALSGILVLVVIIAFIAKIVDKYEKESRQTIVVAQAPILEDVKDLPAPTNSINGEILISSEENSSSTKSELAATTSPVAPAISPIPTIEQKPVATPIATPISTPAATPIATPAATPISTPVSTPTPIPTAAAGVNNPTEVIVEALNKVDIRYSFGNEKWETVTLLADEFHTFKSKTFIHLEVSDGGSISLIINGRDRGIPGSIGKPIKLSYPK